MQFKCPEKIDYVLIESKLMYHDIKNETLRIIKLLGILRIFHLFRVAQTEPSVAMDQHILIIIQIIQKPQSAAVVHSNESFPLRLSLL